ncbi:MAG: TonB-dependent receptor [Bacteroidetes bacterium]|nr:TonB-dependent receptor [Bacteroidota bacterium]
MSRPFIYKTILLTMFITPFLALAQEGAIAGYISDKQNNSPLTGVTVNLAGYIKLGGNSDHFGMFKMKNLPAGHYDIIFSHVGYQTEKIPVDVQENKMVVIHTGLQRTNLTLSDVTISSKKTSPFNTIASVDIKLRPLNTSQDILRIVPGLFIAQHAGGGKAEQIFLRGYDIDHGTDLNISADGLPVNMVSHAHGQGYADLHFLIPEIVDKVNFDKGPYFANKGNLATAGFVELHTKDFLDNNTIKVQGGEFNTQRIAGFFKLLNKQAERNRQQFYVASEYFKSNGYFESPQDFHRFNITGKYNAIFNNKAQLTVLASNLESKWGASGQIPERAVKNGTIGKFGSIDNSEGGNTNRTNISVLFTKQWPGGWQTSDQLYFIKYHFNLYSDFTFFLNDPVNGDGINQKEIRNVYGYTGTMSKHYLLGNKNVSTVFGWGFRYDDINNIELNHVVKRRFLNRVQNGNIRERNSFIYVNQNLLLNDNLNINAGIRYDNFSFSYMNIIAGDNNFRKQGRGIFSPKLNFTYTVNPSLKIYLNNGIGFHSNDARVILNNSAKNILPKVFGTDLGAIIKPTKNILLKAAVWHLYSEQEFVYVGDEGIVEPAGKTRRTGIDASVRYQVYQWLYADLDLNFARPRTIDKPKGNNYVPLAPTFTSIGGITIKMKAGLNTSLRYRYIDSRPANENNTIRADGYFLLDAVASYEYKKFELSVSIENILNQYWKEAQFATVSRLKNEIVPVSEIHYTPGTPRFLKAGISYIF